MKTLIAITMSAACLLACKPRVVWSDEFNYTGTPDTTKWNYDLGSRNGWGNNEWQFYTNDPKNVRVENGTLIIEAHKDSLEDKPFTSSRIVSKKKGDWLYGKLEIRAKLPKGKGTWPAIWMLSTDWEYGGWPASGEIDIMEHVGYDPNVVHGTIHTEAYNHIKQTQKEGKITVASSQDEFHVYAIDWQENKIDFFVDDELYHSVARDPKDDFKGWPFDKRFHLLMNIAVGGNWGGKEGVDMDIWPQRMEIDYVRVYQ
jgi:beta-glucanase (GH16 family)